MSVGTYVLDALGVAFANQQPAIKEVEEMAQIQSPALQILGATRSLRRTITDMTRSSDIKNITVNFGSNGRAPASDGGTPNPPQTVSIIITIEADTMQHAELHAA